MPKSSAEPAIDFGREMLLVAAGPLSGVGDSVVISGITDSGQARRVRVVLYQGCLNPAQLATMPFHVVRVPQDSRSAAFEEQLVRDPNCGK